MVKRSRTLTIFFILVVFLLNGLAQQPHRDRAIFVEKKNEFFEKIKKELNEYYQKKKEPKKKLAVDLSGMDLPTSVDQFKHYWYNPPISQGLTGTCWCFAGTSFFESEIYRLTGQKLKLSEMYTVYWEYVEKARRFVRKRGDSFFGQGSELNAVPKIWKQYGIVPEEVYPGKPADQPFHDHSKMFREMKDYLNSVKESNAWNEELVLSTIKSILNHYLGEPPREFKYQGKKYTPESFLKKVVKIHLDDYYNVMSLMEKPFYQFVEYEVPDNWWKCKNYLNVPVNDFMQVVKKAIRAGYTVGIGGDVSEPGYDSHAEVAVVPTFDIPSEYIDDSAREFRFKNHTTTDDHAIHLVGYLNKDGKDWYLIKDSAAGSRNGKNKGYYFYHEDYVKLKIMTLIVHKDMVKDLLTKVKKN